MVGKQKDEYVVWLAQYEWTWFCILTVRDGIHRKKATKLFKAWIKQLEALEGKEVSWYRMFEYGKRTGRLHVHACVAGVGTISPYTGERLWDRLAGKSKIGLYDERRRGHEYSLKLMETTNDYDFDAELHEQHKRKKFNRFTDTIGV